ncbi:ABC transporter permease [Natronosporangium hydrolyticum]|uniref:Transport permease protein n=1 Tax=Natronosporangium hydrolyticum TaxID=2811111 RepID=A0A895YIQ8_9ACTN|nr:ABC transporter permease [Natronosporangium hydrolyticum]QSB15253.1 ABC transporter permease [Natronosporangium hydrolyticum]
MTSSVVGVWRARNVLRFLVRRDLALKYQRSAMGYLWSLIEPIGIGLIYYFVFIVVIGRGGQLEELLPPEMYILYLMAGIFSYMWTSGVLSEATGALTGQKNLITTMNVPREVFPVGRVIARSAEFLAGIPILIGIALLVGTSIGWSLLVLPLAILVQGIFLIGIALLLSSLNVMMQDIERFMRMISRLVFYSSPILYPLAMVKDALPEWAFILYQINPLVGIIELHHAAWFPEMFPSWPLLAACIGGSLFTLGVGWLVFRRLEPAVLKEL